MAALQTTLLVVRLLLLVSGIAFGTVIAYYWLASRRPRSFPAGPTSLPVIGNAHQVPLVMPFLRYTEWVKTHGVLYGLKLGPLNVVVLNDPKHVQQLLDKRGSIYSSRPPVHIAIDHLESPYHILFMPYGDPWRKQRKAKVSFLKSDARHLLPIQVEESTQMLYDLLNRPQECYEHVRRFSAAVIVSSVYGVKIKTYQPLVEEIHRVQDEVVSLLAPGAAPPLDAFTFYQWLPDCLAGWRDRARAVRTSHRKLYCGLLAETRKRVAAGEAEGCMVAGLLKEQQQKGSWTDEQILYASLPMIEAGADTTAATLQSWIVAVVNNPEVLRKMQHEVDKVCGDRMPEPNNLAQLPYVKAVMKETLRWRPTIPLGIPHCSTKDDWYEGHYLPKDTMIFMNIWGMSHDAAVYPKPETFLPERFLGNDLEPPYTFGAGRRVCVGQRFAETSIMLVMAKVAWAFDIGTNPACSVDSSVENGYHNGLSIAPKRFQVDLEVRSRKREEAIGVAMDTL